ncbi:MAG TPA: BTAD domain-containing putative transcriptional regulator [Gemmatimonadales bacterium]|nr:BTAD domain-containing putative transcriptional regulator [Gemmatimonadales bacterium]
MSTSLPIHLTRFIGRDRELAELAGLAVRSRLLTLTGAGGSGKTRLAAELAARVGSGYGRTVWVDLAPLGDHAFLTQQVADAVGVTEHPGTPLLELLVDTLCTQHVLLVLDNCEHLVEACATLVEAMLRGCPRVGVIATSREALGVTGETAWLVPPLNSTEAAQLFVERAQAVLPSFSLADGNTAAVAEICRRVDHLPLAIELAAARVRVLPPEQIAHRLDDAFKLLTTGNRTSLPRHRTLRATMEWSFALLGEREQVLLRRLSVFAGGFTLDAAETVCAGAPLDAEDILDGVAALVDKSLIVMEAGDGTARYRLLETVRQYGAERLSEAGEAAGVERKHAEYYLGVAETAAPHLFGGEDEPGIIASLVVDDDNLRAATAWALRDPEGCTIALRFSDALFWYWYGASAWFGSSHFREARPYVNEALRRGDACDRGVRAGALCSLGLICLATGDYAPASAAFEEALAYVRTTNDPANLAFVLSKLGATRMMMGDLDRAWSLLGEAHLLVEPMERSMLHAFVWFWYAWTAEARGDLGTARHTSQRQIELGVLTRHRTMRGHSHSQFGRVALAEGIVAEAYAHFTAALPLHLDLKDGWGIMLDLEGFAAVAVKRGHYVDAAKLLGASDALRERTIFAIPAPERAKRDQRLKLLREKLGPDELERLLTEGRALTLEQIVDLTADPSMAHTAEHAVVREIRPKAPARLRVNALGPLQVFVDGKPVEAPRELLAYLLLHPDGRTKEQVGLAFWPEASTSQLRNSFHVTLHRLRKALGGADWVVLERERYRINPELIEQFDVWAFEQAIKAGRLEEAAALYRGDLLDGEPVGDWSLEHRDRLQRLYVDSLMKLGARFVKEGKPAQAADAYRRVLERDEMHEEALQGLMKCHAELGERPQALRVYRQFADKLKTEFQSQPRIETSKLFERLQQGR